MLAVIIATLNTCKSPVSYREQSQIDWLSDKEIGPKALCPERKLIELFDHWAQEEYSQIAWLPIVACIKPHKHYEVVGHNQ